MWAGATRPTAPNRYRRNSSCARSLCSSSARCHLMPIEAPSTSSSTACTIPLFFLGASDADQVDSRQRGDYALAPVRLNLVIDSTASLQHLRCRGSEEGISVHGLLAIRTQIFF